MRREIGGWLGSAPLDRAEHDLRDAEPGLFQHAGESTCGLLIWAIARNPSWFYRSGMQLTHILVHDSYCVAGTLTAANTCV